MYRRWRRLVVAISGLVLLSYVVPAIAAATTTGGPIVTISSGKIQGESVGGVDRFLGIPYAQAPTGALRWQPPRPARSWTGVRQATSYGHRCAALASTNGPRTNAEDCLFVNVDRPAGVHAGRGLAVYVFIHGGGLVNGSSNQAGGEKIVRLTNAITVSLNYRLGVFGFLGLPGLSGRGQGDYGFMDQQLALRWVHRNIAAFGGDPARVTLGGESAGAFSVCGHLTAPGSRGLFGQAMMQSGSCFSRTLAQTQSQSWSFAKSAGCTDTATVAACLRSRSAASLLDLSTSFSPTLTSGTSVLPQPTAAAVQSGQFARVPIVNGSNRDEGRTFAAGDIGWTQHQYTSWVQAAFGSHAAAVLAHYPWPAHSTQFSAAYLAGAIITDAGLAAGIGGCTELTLTQTFAKYVPTYAYEFDARQGPGLRPIPGYVWGAGHAAELAYLFPSFNNGTPIAPTFNSGERELSRNMIEYWGGFVFHGAPEFQGQTYWPRFDRTDRIMSLRPSAQNRVITATQYRAEHQCGFWESMS